MKNFTLCLFFISFCSMAGFSGHWESNNESKSLTLDLVEKENNITGRYCFITNNGNRIDCAEDDDININGVTNNNIASVSFESTFGGVGKATLSIQDDELKYTISDNSPFIGANMSVPRVIIFKKTQLK
ncbi:hypothetical protein HB991_02810 [Yersinia mollaretii]|uniref:Lipocalin-like domain-containing protein n=1 Tax=Yersinia mollaretii TaxID=33060 RepID=A0AA44CIQ8_YERMO|nr:hypothetical protein [Yersinia mollaretii]NIL21454.1 hypothetical protein [Yersinia mollaretii]CNI83175.1 Uncharacterised protein [Yersinia mollaretii]CQR07605.1 Uncharacterised protein [Yersinia mollaretii]